MVFNLLSVTSVGTFVSTCLTVPLWSLCRAQGRSRWHQLQLAEAEPGSACWQGWELNISLAAFQASQGRLDLAEGPARGQRQQPAQQWCSELPAA